MTGVSNPSLDGCGGWKVMMLGGEFRVSSQKRRRNENFVSLIKPKGSKDKNKSNNCKSIRPVWQIKDLVLMCLQFENCQRWCFIDFSRMTPLALNSRLHWTHIEWGSLVFQSSSYHIACVLPSEVSSSSPRTQLENLTSLIHQLATERYQHPTDNQEGSE